MVASTPERLDGISEEEYRAIDAVSYSSLKDLDVSPLRFWHKHINPNRVKEEPTPAMVFGSALHCAVLDPDQFDSQYAPFYEPQPGELVTIADIRGWISDKGHKPKGTRKGEVIEQALSIDPMAPIAEVLQSEYGKLHAGKRFLGSDQLLRVKECAEALKEEPEVQRLMSDGRAEVPLYAVDDETGVAIKARLDWMAATHTVDVKTFTQQRGGSIERTVCNAIHYEKYDWQAVMYHMLRGWPKWDGDHVLIFVESDAPHDVRIKALRSRTSGQSNAYWTTALLKIRHLLREYKKHREHFGIETPWRWAQEVDPLIDEQLPGVFL